MESIRGLWIGNLVATIFLTIGIPTAWAADEPIVIIARFYIVPGQEAAYEARGLKAVEFVRNAEPNTIYRLQRSAKDPSLFVYYEVYPSQAALDHHIKVVLPAFFKEAGPRPEGMFSRPPEVERFLPIEK